MQEVSPPKEAAGANGHLPAGPHTAGPTRRARAANAAYFRPHLRKQDDVANARAVGQQHDQTIDADAAAAGRRQAVLERADVVGVVVHRLIVAGLLRLGLLLETRGLVLRVVQLGEAVGDLAPGDEQLEALGDVRVGVAASRQRRYLRRVVDDEGRIHRVRLRSFLRTGSAAACPAPPSACASTPSALSLPRSQFGRPEAVRR